MNIQSLIPWSRGGERAMSVFDRSEADPFLALHRDVNRLFDDALRGFGLPLAGRSAGFDWPSLEMREADGALTVTAETPGLGAEDVEILLEDGALVLRGEKRAEVEDAGRRFSERFYGRFERRVPLPCEVEADAVSAEFRDGVLTVTLPKTPQAQSQVRRIEVKKAS